MYKSPIDIIYGQMETQLEGTVLKAIQNVGVNVDKEELIRALKYDREQYEKGFEDGQPTWIPVSERLPEIPDGWAENPEPVLYMMKSTKTIYVGYYGEGGVLRDKYFRQYLDGLEGVDADDVLCWMWQHDLPEPPKGEKQ